MYVDIWPPEEHIYLYCIHTYFYIFAVIISDDEIDEEDKEAPQDRFGKPSCEKGISLDSKKVLEMLYWKKKDFVSKKLLQTVC